MVEHAVRRSCLPIKLKRVPENDSNKCCRKIRIHCGHIFVTASFHVIPNQFRRSPWVETLVNTSQQHEWKCLGDGDRPNGTTSLAIDGFSRGAALLLNACCSHPTRYNLFVCSAFQKVIECWHIFVLHTSNGFSYQNFNNKIRFSDMMPFHHNLELKPLCMSNSNRTDQNLWVTEQGMRSYKWRKTGSRVSLVGYLAPIPARLRGRGSHVMPQEPALLPCKMTFKQYIYLLIEWIFVLSKNHLD